MNLRENTTCRGCGKVIKASRPAKFDEELNVYLDFCNDECLEKFRLFKKLISGDSHNEH